MNGNKNPIICYKYVLSNSYTIYFLDNISIGFSQKLLWLNNNEVEKIVKVDTGYPGNRIKDIKSDGDSIFFTYSGWHNPEKIVKVSAGN